MASKSTRPLLSIIVPVLNESAIVEGFLEQVQPFRRQGCEVIVVDGGSSDVTVQLARPLVDRLIESPAGRAVQMNAGSQSAGGEVLWFLHADSQPPPDSVTLILRGLENNARQWGRFDVKLSGAHWLLRVVEGLMNWRARLTGIATGDQGIFVRRACFQAIGGFPEIPLMEDIEIAARLKKTGAPLRVPAKLVTSSRRWEENGVLRTIVSMWVLRAAHALGVDPSHLQRRYYSSTP